MFVLKCAFVGLPLVDLKGQKHTYSAEVYNLLRSSSVACACSKKKIERR